MHTLSSLHRASSCSCYHHPLRLGQHAVAAARLGNRGTQDKYCALLPTYLFSLSSEILFSLVTTMCPSGTTLCWLQLWPYGPDLVKVSFATSSLSRDGQRICIVTDKTQLQNSVKLLGNKILPFHWTWTWPQARLELSWRALEESEGNIKVRCGRAVQGVFSPAANA